MKTKQPFFSDVQGFHCSWTYMYTTRFLQLDSYESYQTGWQWLISSESSSFHLFNCVVNVEENRYDGNNIQHNWSKNKTGKFLTEVQWQCSDCYLTISVIPNLLRTFTNKITEMKNNPSNWESDCNCIIKSHLNHSWPTYLQKKQRNCFNCD